MSDSSQANLDSAAAVEVAAFCWPGLEWRLHQNKDRPMCITGFSTVFNMRDWSDLHRAAAVLVGRGHSRVLGKHLVVNTDADFENPVATAVGVVAAAPSDAWARAVLATVREVSK